MSITVDDIRLLLARCSKAASDSRAELCRADALYGDGDLGTSLARGFAAVERIPVTGGPIAAYLRQAALVFNDAASSTCGTLLAIGLRRVAQDVEGKETLAVRDVVAVLEGFAAAIMQKGGAQLGDKTFLDVVVPTVAFCKERMAASDGGNATWVPEALNVLRHAESTARSLSPKRGRARMFAEKAVGSPDAGAVAAVVLCTALLEWVQQLSQGEAGERVGDANDAGVPR